MPRPHSVVRFSHVGQTREDCYKSIGQYGAQATISPRHKAKQLRGANSLEKPVLPDTHLHQIQQDGRFVLGVANVFTRESLAENAVLRFTCILDLRFRARRGDTQRTKRWMKCVVLNRMVNFGMPKSERMS